MPPDDVKRRVEGLQESLRELDWIAVVPQHFLHVSAPASAAEWRSVAPFPIAYRRVNCFHNAVIVEAHADGAFPAPPFLPHLSIGYFRRSEGVKPLREALAPLRDAELGIGVVKEIVLCEVPNAKTTFLGPWRVLVRVRLGG